MGNQFADSPLGDAGRPEIVKSNSAREISPLMRLLCELTFDEIFNFLARTGLHYHIRHGRDGKHRASIAGAGTVRYMGAHDTSAKAALADSLAKFLVYEKRDYHTYATA